MPAKRPIEDRFWEKVKRDDPDGCWEWQAALFQTGGYGQIWHKNTMYRAHRLSWELTHGEIPEGTEVCHKCDNPACVNPAHLFLGTRQDNIDDMMGKGRYNRNRNPGGRKYVVKLSADDVRRIRSLAATGLSQRSIASIFHITHTSVGYIVRRKHWKHIE